MKNRDNIKSNTLLMLEKIWFKMKLTTILLFSFTLCLYAGNSYSQNTSVNLEMENVSLGDIFLEIESQSEYRFFFNHTMLDKTCRVNVNMKDKTIADVLDELFENTDLSYKLIDKYIVITNSKNKKEKNVPMSTADVIKIIGVVKDELGEPMVGVSIRIKDTSVGTITDIDGKYSIDIPNINAVLVFSYVGYETQEINTANKTFIDVILYEDRQAIDEVVVIGYGSVRKSDLTGSVSQIRSDILQNQAILSDPVQGLQGKVAGLDVTIGSKPGEKSSPIIRGFSSIVKDNATSKDAPLIVLDGAPFGGDISDINPAEIEAIDVLKDASSTAIYGSRGSNGVIIITTKRGKMDGRVSVSYDGYIGVSKSFKNYDMMSGDTYAAYRRAANPGKTDEELFVGVHDILATKNYADWQKETFSGTGYQTDNNITVQVSKDKMSNVIVLGYNKNQSIIDNMSSERFSARLNGDVKLFNNLQLGYSAMLMHRTTNKGKDDIFQSGTRLDPISRMYDEEGKHTYYPSPYAEGYMQINPYFYSSDEYLENQVIRDRAFFSIFADWQIMDGLSFKTSLTPDLQFVEEGQYNSPYMNEMNYSSLKYKKASEKSMTFTNILNYKKQKGIHAMDVSLVHDMQTFRYDYMELEGSDVPYYGKWYNVNEAPDIFKRSSAYQFSSLLSFMGRINYTLMDKYLFTLTGRYDGSSRLAKGNKWDFFPSAAFAWRINSESFLEDVDVLSNLKLRLSWGNTGNAAVNIYATSGAFKKYPYVFGVNESSAIGYVPNELPNGDLGWERTEEYNLGLDFGFFNNRVEGSIDIYRRNTYDLLMERYLPISTGYDKTWQNVGKTRNSGIEIALNTVPFVNKDWRWSLGITFAYNKNQIVELYDGLENDYGNRWFVGSPLHVEYIYEYAGVWQYGEEEEAAKYGYEPGQPKVKDFNNNGLYDQDDQIILNKIPKVIGGLNTTLKYKNFDLNLYFYSRLGYGQRIQLLTHEVGSARWNTINMDFWTPDNPSNVSPRPILSNSQPLLENSTYAYRDLSFIRLKNINLGYTFPLRSLEKIKANRLRLYLAVDNPFVWTMHKFEGLDPESCLKWTDHRPMTSFAFGVNVAF